MAGARPYFERALAIREQTLGPHHPDTALSLNNLGALLDSMGDLAGARPYFERALAIYEQALGPHHPDTALSLNNLAILCFYEGRMEEAATLMRRALAIYEQALGPHHPDTHSSRQSLDVIEQRLSQGAPPTAAQQIAAILEQAEAAMVQALAAGDTDAMAALMEQLEQRAQWAEEGEGEGSPYLDLAARLRELTGYLTLAQRAGARVAEVLATGTDAQRAELAVRIDREAAEAGGIDRVASAFVNHLRNLAARLRAER